MASAQSQDNAPSTSPPPPAPAAKDKADDASKGPEQGNGGGESGSQDTVNVSMATSTSTEDQAPAVAEVKADLDSASSSPSASPTSPTDPSPPDGETKKGKLQNAKKKFQAAMSGTKDKFWRFLDKADDVLLSSMQSTVAKLPKELFPPESPEFCEMIEDFGKWKVLYERTLNAIRKTYKAMGELTDAENELSTAMSFSGQKLQGPQGESVFNFGETHGQAYQRREAFLQDVNKYVFLPMKSNVEIAIDDVTETLNFYYKVKDKYLVAISKLYHFESKHKLKSSFPQLVDDIPESEVGKGRTAREIARDQKRQKEIQEELEQAKESWDQTLERTDSKLRMLEGKRKIDYAVQLGRHMEKFTNLHRELSISYAKTESSTQSLRECSMDVDLRL